MAGPLTIKLRCASWGQLEQIYSRDLIRSAIFLKTQKPPPIGTRVRINLTLPSETLIILSGHIKEHVGPDGLGGRGPGVDIALAAVPQSAMWLIESALSSAKGKETSAVRRMPAASTAQAQRQKRAQSQPSIRRLAGDAGLDDGRSFVDAERELVAALRSEFDALRKRNAFQILGVTYEASDQDVRDSFAKLTKKYHPDRYARYESADARELASEVFILIRDAYRRIGNPRAREQTLRALGGPALARAPVPRPTTTARAPTPPTASPQPARVLSGNDLFDASSSPVQTTSTPVDLSGPKPINSELDRADQLVEAGRIDEALKLYSITARRTPGDRRARAGLELCEGIKALIGQDRMEAAQRFEMVLELEPENARAASELAEMRRQATQERKGLLARLLGKKES